MCEGAVRRERKREEVVVSAREEWEVSMIEEKEVLLATAAEAWEGCVRRRG